MVTVREWNAASGRVAGRSSRAMSATVSSTIGTVWLTRSARPISARCSSGISAPAGLWKSGIR